MVTRNERIDEPLSRPVGIFQPANDLEREEVRRQLIKVLASPAFHNCKRYAAVLKYVVDKTLDGCGDQLKERTIGIDVFDRVPDYDTATDHAVRSAVGEVRKRLGQYYQQDTKSQLRIEVLPGSYTPQFRWVEINPAPLSASLDGAPAPAQYRGLRILLRPKWLIAAVLVLGAVVLSLSLAMRPQDPLGAFWGPVLNSRAPVLLCIGNLEGGRELAGDGANEDSSVTLNDFHNSASETVNVYDAITIAKLTGLMEARGKQFQLATQSDATFSDLQKGPTVLVGLMNNDWTGRLLPNLRFSVEHPASNKVIIRDRKNPSNQEWSMDYTTPYLNVTRDYALVLRMVDPKTEQVVVVVAGITVFGTFAGGDFLTNKDTMKKLVAIAPPGWEKKNMEIVLSTDVIRGRSGPANVVATQFW